ncbi:13949_t:CDS:2, partial [Acaulospora colombiana]
DAMDVDPSESDFTDDMDVPLSKEKKVNKRRKDVFDELDGLGETMAAAIRFGFKLRDDYGKDEREEIKSALEDASSLLAYTDPRVSCVAHLLDPSGREPVANALNSAILANPEARAHLDREVSANKIRDNEVIPMLRLDPVFLDVLAMASNVENTLDVSEHKWNFDP